MIIGDYLDKGHSLMILPRAPKTDIGNMAPYGAIIREKSDTERLNSFEKYNTLW
jgi:hypothetical protein